MPNNLEDKIEDSSREMIHDPMSAMFLAFGVSRLMHERLAITGKNIIEINTLDKELEEGPISLSFNKDSKILTIELVNLDDQEKAKEIEKLVDQRLKMDNKINSETTRACEDSDYAAAVTLLLTVIMEKYGLDIFEVAMDRTPIAHAINVRINQGENRITAVLTPERNVFS